MEQRQATPLHGRGLNPVDEHIEELSLAQLEDIHGGFIWILARFYMQQVYLRSKKEKEQQDEDELFSRVIFD
jgi:anti-sigma regulatory factor (Ser/Thr protein kinase)